MAALGIRKSTFQGLSDRDKDIVRHIGALLQLGTPVTYEAPGAVEWFVFDDTRFRAAQVAYMGCVFANFNDIPGGYEIPTVTLGEPPDEVTVADWAQLRSDIMAFCENPARTNPFVPPGSITFTEDGNPWQEILDAQNCPNAVQMASSVPDTWTEVAA